MFCRLGHSDVLLAELDAIEEGLKVCQQLNLHSFTLETDSSLAFNMILQPTCEHWKYTYTLRRIRTAIGDCSRMKLIYREQNKVTDGLVKVTHSSTQQLEFFQLEDIPLGVQKCIFLDRISIPNFRSSCT